MTILQISSDLEFSKINYIPKILFKILSTENAYRSSCIVFAAIRFNTVIGYLCCEVESRKMRRCL